MKRLLLVLGLWSLLGVSALAAVPFAVYKDAVTPSVPTGFTYDTENDLMMQIKFKGHAAQMDVLTYDLRARQKQFTQMDAALGAKPWKWQGHSAIFIDGAQSGMSVVAVKLDNGAGFLYVTHRVFGGTPMGLDQLKAVLKRIDLKTLEG